MITILKLIKIFFITLGVIFFGLIILAGYLWVTDPWNLKPILFYEGPGINNSLIEETNQPSSTSSSTSTEADQANLSAEQEAALEDAGINPNSLPSDISDEQMACFEAQLGSDRVNEIMAGATPTTMELIKASACL